MPQTKHNICIYGVGRSGTTAIYTMLQKILENINHGDTDYRYEPLLWNKLIFNDLYENVTDKFSDISSISIDAIYQHKSLPLFIDAVEEDHINSSGFLKEILETDKHNLLCKFIRCNGRIPLIKRLLPDSKSIIIIRNPLDVLNSSSSMFSFFGDDIYESDYERFTNEISDVDITDTPIEREYSYWLYMNKAALEYYRNNKKDCFLIVYENYLTERENIIKGLCEFLEIDYNTEFIAYSEKKVGSVQSDTNNLSENDFNFLKSKLDVYKDMLAKVGEEVALNPVINKYNNREFLCNESEYKYKNSLYLINVIKNLQNTLLQQKKNQEESVKEIHSGYEQAIESIHSEYGQKIDEIRSSNQQNVDKIKSNINLLRNNLETSIEARKELQMKFKRINNVWSNMLSISVYKNPFKKYQAYKAFGTELQKIFDAKK